jgi:hypothetical protein
MVADELDYVVGVDTHLDEHVLAVVAAPTGAVVARHAVQANARGYAVALRFAHEAAGGARVLGHRGHRQLRRRPCPLPQRPPFGIGHAESAAVAVSGDTASAFDLSTRGGLAGRRSTLRRLS